VQSVDQTANTVTLKDGTVIRIVAGTEFDAREGNGMITSRRSPRCKTR